VVLDVLLSVVASARPSATAHYFDFPSKLFRLMMFCSVWAELTSKLSYPIKVFLAHADFSFRSNSR